MKCRETGAHVIFCNYELLQVFYTVDIYTTNKRWPWYCQKEARLKKEKRKEHYVAIWWYEEIIVNLLMIEIEIVVCFVEECLSFRGKCWSIYGWNDRPSGFALK